MKPEEVVTRPFYLYPTTDQAAKYQCSGHIYDRFVNKKKMWNII